MVKTKTKWTKTPPSEEGWYWFKYTGKHGKVVCPCCITRFKSGEWIIRTGYNDTFVCHSWDRESKQYKASFGPAIPLPD